MSLHGFKIQLGTKLLHLIRDWFWDYKFFKVSVYESMQKQLKAQWNCQTEVVYKFIFYDHISIDQKGKIIQFID